MPMHEYFMGMTQLELINRAPGFFKYQPHNVAAHSWKVTQIAQFLADVEEQNGAKINWQSVYEKALNHDYTERFIGDIKTPVKYATSTLRSMLADVEDSMTENFIKTEIPAQFQAAYTRRLGEGKDDSIEGQILSIADKIDLMYEAYGELEKFNPEPVYVSIFQSSLEALSEYQSMASVKYLATEILPDIFHETFIHKALLYDLAKSLLPDFAAKVNNAEH
ncbi:HD domain-containing protein [Leuconostoc falkenbergense]|jgi:putative hydrolases of HD superfamily|uniref:HD domain-containing protein n=2 Tax=Leuconostoc TaxID=1243 RepID=A0A9X3INT1_9LACO|nr:MULTISPECIES: YfbR-like 5'-deoxynucleotidase [Leuconostoc]KDA48070.1 Nucleotidase YfbR, HD superfamily [Leuconostoc pseudomesenteroides 1159]KDA50835.1 Nucleotidase YfbR, HD superfamily [Leuconostoc pseudomesenteroides PS12]CCJ66049.1 Nucleotidase YfbR, HD superfamily [Leuconostoc pseudomesenteroides 4882]MCT4377854.1 HD domain-containing protein [Leuconostoc falkenbergense]MCT4389544.1 HD domain-containing protein [Leuconostoc falkenbergense]